MTAPDFKPGDHECVFVEEETPEGCLLLGPCLACGITAAAAIASAAEELRFVEGAYMALADQYEAPAREADVSTRRSIVTVEWEPSPVLSDEEVTGEIGRAVDALLERLLDKGVEVDVSAKLRADRGHPA